MSTIVFQKAGLSDLTIERGRILPLELDNIAVNHDMYLTEDNKPKVTDYGDSLNLIRLAFKSLTKDNYDGVVNGLKTWFESTQINWAENSFTMTDESQVVHTVRWWQKKFGMPLSAAGLYSISFILLKE